MSNFKTSYQTPLDRGYLNQHMSAEPTPEQNLERPIIPIGDLGITVVEKDAMTGGNILQNVQAAIRKGVTNIQFVMTTPHTSPMGGRPKAYGEEVREAIRETARANELFIGGLEMPTSSMNNLSGFDNRSGFSEQKRYDDMEEVRDAIKFVADTAEGGGVDILSQEFPRTIFDAEWNKDGFFFESPAEHEDAVKHLVDPETGKIIESIRVGNEVFTPEWNVAQSSGTYIDAATGEQMDVNEGDWVDYDGKPIYDPAQRVPKFNMESQSFEIVPKRFDDFKEEAKILTEKRKKEFKEAGKVFTQDNEVSTEEAVFIAQAEGRASELRGHAGQSTRRIKNELEDLKRLQEARAIYRKVEALSSDEEKEQWKRKASDQLAGLKERNIYIPPKDDKSASEILDELIYQTKRDIQNSQELATGYTRQAKEAEKKARNVVSAHKFAKRKTFESYAELGMAAMKEGETNVHAKRDLYVGPELGWPGSWGGHPEEFIELVNKSREVMAEKLVKEMSFSEKEAKARAKRHIKGLFDTSHMGMWLRNFKREENESGEEHRKRFNKWYLEMTDKLIQSGTVGSIQAVDSASGAHGHLPPGSGIFPIVEAVQRFKKAGFDGFIVSEGHEEEQFGHGRLFTKMWSAFGSPIGGSSYGGPTQWRSIQRGYLGRTYTPNFMVAGYAPSNDFKLWSEIPLE